MSEVVTPKRTVNVKFAWACPGCGKDVDDAMAYEEAHFFVTSKNTRTVVTSAHRECIWCKALVEVEIARCPVG